jgi:hypothetical protein
MSATFTTKEGRVITFSLKTKDPLVDSDPKVKAWFEIAEKILAKELEGKAIMDIAAENPGILN